MEKEYFGFTRQEWERLDFHEKIRKRNKYLENIYDIGEFLETEALLKKLNPQPVKEQETPTGWGDPDTFSFSSLIIDPLDYSTRKLEFAIRERGGRAVGTDIDLRSFYKEGVSQDPSGLYKQLYNYDNEPRENDINYIIFRRNFLARLNEEDCKLSMKYAEELLRKGTEHGWGAIVLSVPHEDIFSLQENRENDWVSYMPLEEPRSEGTQLYKQISRRLREVLEETIIWKRPNKFYLDLLQRCVQGTLPLDWLLDEENIVRVNEESLKKFNQRGIIGSPAFFQMSFEYQFNPNKAFTMTP